MVYRFQRLFEPLEERARISMLLSWHHHAVRKTVMLNYNLPTWPSRIQEREKISFGGIRE